MHRLVLAAVVATLTTSVVEAGYLPEKVQMAIHDRLSSPNMALGAIEPKFFRYASDGKGEAFSCDYAAAYQLYAFHSDHGGAIAVGYCAKDLSLNERYAEVQIEAFKVAVGGSADQAQKTLPEMFRSKTSRKANKTIIYLPQFIATGIGGVGGHGAAGVESVLIIPDSGKWVVFAQGTRPGNACNNAERKLEACEGMPNLLEELAEMVLKMQSANVP